MIHDVKTFPQKLHGSLGRSTGVTNRPLHIFILPIAKRFHHLVNKHTSPIPADIDNDILSCSHQGYDIPLL